MAKENKAFKKWWGLWLKQFNFYSSEEELEKALQPLLATLKETKAFLEKEEALSKKKRLDPILRENLESIVKTRKKVIKQREKEISLLKARLLRPDHHLNDSEKVLETLKNHAKIYSVAAYRDILHIVTKPLFFRGGGEEIGRFLMKIQIHKPAELINLDWAYGGNRYAHPNVSRGNLCTGSYAQALADYAKLGELFFVVDLVINILESPGRGNPFLYKEDWLQGREHK